MYKRSDMLELNSVNHGDCLERMNYIPDESIDMILCDLPYGVTSRCKWDVVLPFDKLWEQYNRIIKPNGCIALTATQPFSSVMVMSNPKMFRYDIIWEKTMAVGFLNAKRMPLRAHEIVNIFYKKLPTYNPQYTYGEAYNRVGGIVESKGVYNEIGFERNTRNKTTRNPRSVVKISNPNHGSLHPTQKPVELFEYLIKTYTDEWDLVLDNAAGSGTTAIAAINTNRNYILIEKEEEYVKIAKERIKNVGI